MRKTVGRSRGRRNNQGKREGGRRRRDRERERGGSDLKGKRRRIKSLLSSREKIACVRSACLGVGSGIGNRDDRATKYVVGNRENEEKEDLPGLGEIESSMGRGWSPAQSCRTVSSSE